ncbi:hypothetical protein C9424_17135 [Arthrobacter sp. H-02-3]|nr:hypothetical protein C9424_17135 [Arthrobacter sp. H-02-3]
MDNPADSKVWTEYTAAQATRGVRPLCLEAMGLAGPGNGRRAIDLGCGAGKETLALLDGGRQVLAVDSLPDTRERLLATVPAAPGRRHFGAASEPCPRHEKQSLRCLGRSSAVSRGISADAEIKDCPA